MAKRILVYSFPVFLIALEIIFRGLLSLNTETFVGPTMAAVGLTFLLPLIVPKPQHFGLSPKIQREIEIKKILIISRNEQRLIDIIWIFIFILTGCWVYSLYLSSAQPNLLWLNLRAYLVLGYFSYLVGVVFAELKEWVK